MYTYIYIYNYVDIPQIAVYIVYNGNLPFQKWWLIILSQIVDSQCIPRFVFLGDCLFSQWKILHHLGNL